MVGCGGHAGASGEPDGAAGWDAVDGGEEHGAVGAVGGAVAGDEGRSSCAFVGVGTGPAPGTGADRGAAPSEASTHSARLLRLGCAARAEPALIVARWCTERVGVVVVHRGQDERAAYKHGSWLLASAALVHPHSRQISAGCIPSRPANSSASSAVRPAARYSSIRAHEIRRWLARNCSG